MRKAGGRKVQKDRIKQQAVRIKYWAKGRFMYDCGVVIGVFAVVGPDNLWCYRCRDRQNYRPAWPRGRKGLTRRA